MKTLLALALGAVLLAPSAALAQSNGHWNRNWNGASPNGTHDRDDRARQDRDNRARQDRDDRFRRDRDDRSGYYNNGYHNGYSNQYGYPGPNGYTGAVSGRIASFNRGDITLQNGRTVFLNGGTAINGNLMAGERIAITGTDAGNGNVNAQTVNVLGF